MLRGVNPFSFLSFHLIALGHDVATADDVDTAWKAIQTGGCQIVISDRSMPGISGADLCSRIRSSSAKGYVYFIRITSHQGRDKLSEAMDAGVDDFMAKPVDLDTLATRIHVAARILGFHRQMDVFRKRLHDQERPSLPG